MPGKKLWICLSLALFFNSCGDEHFVPSRGLQDWEYFPLKEGDVSIYQHQQITYLGRNVTPDTLSYKIKEEAISANTDTDGSTTFTMLTSRTDSSGIWVPQFYWTIRKEYDRCVFTIDNQEYVELQLPLLEGYYWEGHPTGTLCPDDNGFCDMYMALNVDKDFLIEGKAYNHTLKVQKQEKTDELQISSDEIEYNIYAKDTGLIYAEYTQIEYASCRNNQNPDCCCDGDVLCTLCAGEIEFGSITKKMLIEKRSK